MAVLALKNIVTKNYTRMKFRGLWTYRCLDWYLQTYTMYLCMLLNLKCILPNPIYLLFEMLWEKMDSLNAWFSVSRRNLENRFKKNHSVSHWSLKRMSPAAVVTSTQESWISRVLSLRNRKHVPCFYRVIEIRVELWENKKSIFRVLPNFHECFYNSIETLLENTAATKRKTTC